jgi:hypothetical protein
MDLLRVVRDSHTILIARVAGWMGDDAIPFCGVS